MNKQEAIKKVEQMVGYEHFVDELISKKGVLNILNQLDEPEKVKVPQFVADWIEEKRDMGWKLTKMVLQANLNEQYWRWVVDNQETFARAWLDGYEVEKEKRYLVKIKGNIKENMLVYGELLERYYFTKSFSLNNAIYSHTRKELEEAGFGEVFNSPLFEIEEVEG